MNMGSFKLENARKLIYNEVTIVGTGYGYRRLAPFSITPSLSTAPFDSMSAIRYFLRPLNRHRSEA